MMTGYTDARGLLNLVDLLAILEHTRRTRRAAVELFGAESADVDRLRDAEAQLAEWIAERRRAAA